MARTKAEKAEEAEHDVLIFTIESQALKLFSDGKTPTEVAIKLRISAADTLRLYKDYWKLEGYLTLVKVEAQLGEDLPSLLKLFKKMKNEGMTLEDIIDISRAHRRIPYLKDHLRELEHDVQKNYDFKEQYINEYILINEHNKELEKKNRELQYSNECYLQAINEKKNELTILDSLAKDHKGLDKNEDLLSEPHQLHKLPFLCMDSSTFSDNNSFEATTKKSSNYPASEVSTRKEIVNDKDDSGEKVIE
jgi:hypothetical protein